MGSLIDLNLYPDSPVRDTADVAGATTFLTLNIPKLEPKEEPLDDVPHPLPSHANHPNPNLSLTLNTHPDASQPPAEQPAVDENDVYSEFSRIQEMFKIAFSNNKEKFDAAAFMDPDSQAIVPVPEENQHSTAVADSSRRKNQQRSGELVRVTNLGAEDERYFRDVVRKTRMLYDSLRVFVTMEDEKRRNHVFGRVPRARGDLKASSVMKDRGLWLNRDKRIVGAIPGVYIGDIFFFRMELCVVGMHGLPQAGIDYLTSSQSSNGDPIATSIIVSGGYEDDQDAGDVIIYTGHGGQDKYSRQADHQRLEGGNLAMERSMHYGTTNISHE